MDPAAASSETSSFAALKREHAALSAEALERLSLPGEAEAAAARVRTFLREVRTSGRHLQDRTERRAAKGLLDFWSTALITSPAALPEDLVPLALDPAVRDMPAEPSTPDAAVAAAPSAAAIEASAPPKSPAPRSEVDDARSQIRIAAVARQYAELGGSGYLLSGKALDEARRFVDDEDVRALVAASEKALRADRTIRWGIRALGALIIAGLAYYAVDETNDRKRLKGANEELVKSEKHRIDDKEIAEQKLSEADAALASQRSENAVLQAQVSAAIDFLAAEVKAGRLRLESAPEDLRPDVEAAVLAAGTDPAAAPPPPVADLSAYKGYDETFLGVAIEMPSTKQEVGAGPPLNYLHYSVVMHRARRIPIFTASNLDRSSLRRLPRTPLLFQNDPRLPPDRQAPEEWFRNELIDHGHLVSRRDIAWGSDFASDPIAAARQLAALIDVNTNVAPMFDLFNSGVWSDLESWSRSEFNSGGSLVSIFTGPVLSDEDPVVDGAQMPRAFWKVVVSTNEAGGNPVSDGFLIFQFKDGSTDSIGFTAFKPDVYRVPISSIERLTGLKFDPIIRSAQTAVATNFPGATPKARELTYAATQVSKAPKGGSGATRSVLVAGLKEGGASEQAQLTAVLSLTADPPGAGDLTDVLAPLAETPASNWTKAAWAFGRARARRFIGQADAQITSSGRTPGAEEGALLAQLKDRIGWSATSGYIVYLQFAGLTRSAAVDVGQQLRQVNWDVPGEERTANADKVNEVRYGESDRDAAQLLVGDLRALGWTKAKLAPKPYSKIKRGNLEVWISQ